MIKELKAIAAAFTFLTRIPAGKLVPHNLEDLPRSAVWFPLVGAVVGMCGAAVLLLSMRWWSPSVAVVLSIVATVRITGAFHEDALADAIDGFGGGQAPDQVLAIMKDSRVGSYALIGVILFVLLKWAILADFSTEHSTPPRLWHGYPFVAALLVSAHCVGRCSSIWLMKALQYVKPKTTSERASAGKPFVNGVNTIRAAAATAITLLIVVAALGSIAWLAIVTAVVITVIAGRYFLRRIGGITGDTLGAANQVVELSIYLAYGAVYLPTELLR